jgi:hypothetical protein
MKKINSLNLATTVFFIGTIGLTTTQEPVFASSTSTDNSDLTSAAKIQTAKPGVVYTPEQLGIDIPIPPKGFNPLTASSAELIKYGFPPRPTNAQDLAEWTTMINHSKTFITPDFEINNNARTPLEQSSPATISSGYQTPNWSGVIDTWSQNGFDGVKGKWTLPNLATNGGDTKQSYSSMWVGIGGFTDNNHTSTNGLFQIGTEQDYAGGGENYYPWYEVLGKNSQGGTNGQVVINKFQIYPNDQMYGYVDYYPSSGEIEFYLDDATRNTYTHFPVTGYSANWDGYSAEWILERTEEDGEYPSLAKVDNVTFTDAEAAANGNPFYAMTDYTSHATLMYDLEGTTLAYLKNGITSSTSFTDNWQNYGTTDSPSSFK